MPKAPPRNCPPSGSRKPRTSTGMPLARIESAKRAEIDVFVEGNLESECTKQELWQVPPGQQLLEESWDRPKSLHTLKSNQNHAKLAGENVQSNSRIRRAHHDQNMELLLTIRIVSAEHHELQIIEDIVYEKIFAEDQQKRLKELDKKHHDSVLAQRGTI
ncbi:unnamed protein product [Sphagnum troendelagicum]|uniref:Uncharacterized protein n=1 Tax=Sphagnum troendelagicum TaxID=128251 RepID=A0ABP0UU65_9BRYO